MRLESNLRLFLEVIYMQIKWLFGIGIGAAVIASVYFVIKLNLIWRYYQ